MTLTVQEATDAYDELVTAARAAGLSWIILEVEEQAALGQVELKSLPVEDMQISMDEEQGSLLSSRTRRRRSKATFNVARPLSPHEKLRLLADSLDTGVVELNRVVGSVLDFLAEEVGHRELLLAPEGEIKPTVLISPPELDSRQESASTLSRLLQELKRSI